MRKLLAAIGLVIPFLSICAKEQFNLDELKKEYSKYNAVITSKEEVYVFDIVDDTLNVSQTVKRKVMILNEFSKAFTNDLISHSSFCRLEEKEAYTLVPNGKKYQKVSVDNFQESHNRDGSVFYDDSKIVQFSYPSLQEGAVTSLEYKFVYNDPHFIRSAFLQSYIPIIKSKVLIKYHRAIDLGYFLQNTEQLNLDVKTYSKGKYNYIEFEADKVDRFKYFGGNYYSIRHFSPHLMIYLKEVNLDGQKEKYFGSVDDLYHYMVQYIEEANADDSDDLTQLVQQLTKGLSEDEKVKQIYYWVQKNIKYIAYEDGYDGFRPMKAVDVYKKRFGDCKGMSSLIRKMMLIAGVDGHFTWVGTRHLPYKYTETPLPSVDNHMIAAYLKGNSVIVLDGTFKYLDFGIVPYHIQGKEILVEMGSSNYQIHQMPVSPAQYSIVKDSVVISLDNDTVKGKATRIQTGFNKLELAHAMDGVKTDKYDKSFTRLFNKGNNKFNVTDYHVHNLFQHDQPAVVDYEFTLQDYYKHFEDEIYVNLNLDKSYMDMEVDTSSITGPIENDFYCIENYITVFEIPDGYEVTYIPENGEYSSDKFGFSINYQKDGDKVVMNNNIQFDFFYLIGDDLLEWNKMVAQLRKHYRSTIVLKKI
ncbi:transglutaminase domain-containing protein [Carboxylicivirga linearis]|uniref:DUF3857 domain-containing protein n=1 Tax=Carboxylicivirga linearis TaxID=1628157 RepID=A0ABS5JY36_9BACT|nr:DUF3857 domain-containing protein [Carboxylicivirga linearis]MBS2099824.1 DUF3857 domain-containing protein [Carboxylicivirga linearis]